MQRYEKTPSSDFYPRGTSTPCESPARPQTPVTLDWEETNKVFNDDSFHFQNTESNNNCYMPSEADLERLFSSEKESFSQLVARVFPQNNNTNRSNAHTADANARRGTNHYGANTYGANTRRGTNHYGANTYGANTRRCTNHYGAHTYGANTYGVDCGNSSPLTARPYDPFINSAPTEKTPSKNTPSKKTSSSRMSYYMKWMLALCVLGLAAVSFIFWPQICAFASRYVLPSKAVTRAIPAIPVLNNAPKTVSITKLSQAKANTY